MVDLTKFPPNELRILLGCQEYPEGDFAFEIKRVLANRGGR